MKPTNLAGMVFGKLTAMSRAENSAQNRAQWLCRCECGGEKVAQATYLNAGTTRSCGCLGIEQRTKAARSQCTPYSRTNMYRERQTWQNMIARCSDPGRDDFKWYGGRGITVCDRWRGSFELFVADMGRRPAGMTLDRRDSNGNYSPENCRWATMTEQANNRRGNHHITINGETLTIAEWARRVGIGERSISNRIARGWDEKHAVETPVGR